jgi:hypothetical protein
VRNSLPFSSTVDGQPPHKAAARRVRRYVDPGGSPHGNSRPLDLGVLYYRCAAARMVRTGSLDRPVGPHRGHTPPESHGQHRTTAATQHRSSAALLDQYRRSSDHPGSLSHGGSQGFKSLTSTPILAGQSVASLERATLAACSGRAAAANSSRSPAKKALGQRTTRFQAYTMTAESSRTLTPTDARSLGGRSHVCN